MISPTINEEEEPNDCGDDDSYYDDDEDDLNSGLTFPAINEEEDRDGWGSSEFQSINSNSSKHRIVTRGQRDCRGGQDLWVER